MNSLSFNGKIIPVDEPVLLVTNRGYRYGDGLFETMKLQAGTILLADYHFERLFAGLSLLKFDIPKLFTPEKIQTEISTLCLKNKCEKLARVRLSVFRGNGGLYDADKALQYVIECWPLPESINRLNENGLIIGVCPDVQKSCDAFSGLKSASFLPYSMAAQFAKANKLNDCLVLNTKGNIADSTIATIFLVVGNKIITPPLTEGCINGVMRRYLIEKLMAANYELQEEPVTMQQLEQADEIFLTNAIRGIQWVRQCGNAVYTNFKTTEIYSRFSKTN